MKRNYFVPALSLAIAGAVCVGGTMAYLTDTSETATNTFVFSEDDAVGLTLKETVFDEEFDEDGLNKDEENLDVIAHMVPGDVIAKNPTITATGAASYLFIDVTEKNNELEGGKKFFAFEIATGVDGYTWVEVSGDCGNSDGTISYVLSSGEGTAESPYMPVQVSDQDANTSFAILKDNLDDTIGEYDLENPTNDEDVVGSVEINKDLTQEELLTLFATTQTETDFPVPGEEGLYYDVENPTYVDEIPTLAFVGYAIQGANVDAANVEQLFVTEFK